MREVGLQEEVAKDCDYRYDWELVEYAHDNLSQHELEILKHVATMNDLLPHVYGMCPPPTHKLRGPYDTWVFAGICVNFLKKIKSRHELFLTVLLLDRGAISQLENYASGTKPKPGQDHNPRKKFPSANQSQDHQAEPAARLKE